MKNETALSGETSDLHCAIREMAIEFRFMPGEKINESDLAEALGVSRTPVREVLNRLVAEELIDFRKNYGFFCRKLDFQQVLQLSEAYKTFHLSILPFVSARAERKELEFLLQDCMEKELLGPDMPACELAKADQAFLLNFTRLTKNPVMVQINGNISARIRFLRKVMLEGLACKRAYFKTQQDILELLLDGDEANAKSAFEAYLTIDPIEAEKALTRGLGQIYLSKTSL